MSPLLEVARRAGCGRSRPASTSPPRSSRRRGPGSSRASRWTSTLSTDVRDDDGPPTRRATTDPPAVQPQVTISSSRSSVFSMLGRMALGVAGELDRLRGDGRRPVEGVGHLGASFDGLEFVAPPVTAEMSPGDEPVLLELLHRAVDPVGHSHASCPSGTSSPSSSRSGPLMTPLTVPDPSISCMTSGAGQHVEDLLGWTPRSPDSPIPAVPKPYRCF